MRTQDFQVAAQEERIWDLYWRRFFDSNQRSGAAQGYFTVNQYDKLGATARQRPLRSSGEETITVSMYSIYTMFVYIAMTAS